MKESELYIKYITAFRKGDTKTIEGMLQLGFKPDKQRLIELLDNNPLVEKTLFNHSIIINVDTGNTAGHVYGKFPIYDPKEKRIKDEWLGFYPKATSGFEVLVGEGAVLNETVETGRRLKNFETVQVHLPITEEARIRLAEWTLQRTKEKSTYVLTDSNCVAFVHSALQVAGFSDGLVDKFDPENINKLKLKPIMLDLNNYFRYDKRENFMPAVNQVLESRIEAIQAGSYQWQHNTAKAKRAAAEKLTRQNFVDSFFERYHNVEFYQKMYQDKDLTVEDLSWLLRNKAPGMEYRISDTLLDVYQTLNPKLKAQYQHNPRFFLWKLGYQLQTCPEGMQPEIRKLLADSRSKVGSSASMRQRTQYREDIFSMIPRSLQLRDSSYERTRFVSFLPSFLYINPADQFDRQCPNLIAEITAQEKEKRAAKATALVVAGHSFNADCRKELNKMLARNNSEMALGPVALQSANEIGVKELRESEIFASNAAALRYNMRSGMRNSNKNGSAFWSDHAIVKSLTQFNSQPVHGKSKAVNKPALFGGNPAANAISSVNTVTSVCSLSADRAHPAALAFQARVFSSSTSSSSSSQKTPTNYYSARQSYGQSYVAANFSCTSKNMNPGLGSLHKQDAWSNAAQKLHRAGGFMKG